MQDGGELVLLLLLAITIWLFVKLRRARKERDALLVEKKRLEELKDSLNREKVALEAENALLRSDNLKIQLEPHTVTNIMSKLQGHADKLSLGMDAMVSTMNYVLYKSSAHMVSVEEEIGYIEQYVNMHKLLRDEPEGMDVVTDVDEQSPYYNKPYIPHLITGYLIENAFKHGNFDASEFLRILVTLKGSRFRLEVTNVIGPHKESREGGVGLKNMKERLEVLLGKNYNFEHGQVSDRVYKAVLSIDLAT
jgi:two-component system LytT family sensor kinase